MRLGSIVADQYLLEEVISNQEMGAVYKARDKHGRPVAIKALTSDIDRRHQRFAHEVQTLEDLRHPAIVRYLDSGTSASGMPFLVMEWLEGQDLAHFLERRRITLAETLQWAGRIARALGVAHERGVVHRDIKPSNIFLPGGDVAAAKLIDFGIALRPQSSTQGTSGGSLMGTPAYMAPEQARGERTIDARADVFGMGCVMYECLTGATPFAASNPMAALCKILVQPSPRLAESAPHLPEGVDALIARMLAKNPAARLSDGNEMAQAIDSLVAELARDGGHAAGENRIPELLTEREQRWVSVILVRGQGVSRAPDETAPTIELADPQEPRTSSITIAGLRFESLVDGSLVAVVDSDQAATDQVAQAARVAWSVHQELPGRSVALATGRALVGRLKQTGDIIERAVALLETEGPGSGPKSGPERQSWPNVRIDGLSAELLGKRFQIEPAEGDGLVLLGEREDHDKGLDLGRAAPFVGRRRELTALTAAVAKNAEERVANAVLVTGPPGRGKSRLCHELLRRLGIGEGDGIRIGVGNVAKARAKAGDGNVGDIEVWLGQGDPMHAGSPLYILAQLMRRLLDVRVSDALPLRQQKLIAAISARVAPDHRIRVAEFIGQLVGTPPPGRNSIQMRAAQGDPILMGSQLQNAFEDLVMAVTRERPLVLILDDLHWGDHATIALCDRLLRNLADRPLLILAFARSEIHKRFPDVWSERNLTELELAPLSQEAASELAQTVLGKHVSAERIDALVERASGNPLYLEELLRSAANGRWDWPETVLAMIQARLEGLAPRARQLLRAASVLGRTFWRGAIAEMIGGDPAEHLQRLVERQWITKSPRSRFGGETEYRFRHSLVREGAYAMLTDDDRQLGHRLAGRWLEHMGESDPRSLAEHFEIGGLPERAQTYYLRAAEEALERSDLQSARNLAERGIRGGAEGVTLGTLKRIQADVEIWQGTMANVARLSSESMALLPRGTRSWYDAASQAGIALFKLGAHERVERLAKRLCHDVQPHRGDLAAHNGRLVAMARLACQLYIIDQYETADRLLEEIEHITGDAAGADPIVQAELHLCRGARAYEHDGSLERAIEEFELTTACFEKVGNHRQACLNRCNVGFVKGEMGRLREAERDQRNALSTARRLGLDMAVAVARHNLAVLLSRLSRDVLDEALEHDRLAAGWFRKQGDWRMAGWCHFSMAHIHLRQGDLRAAMTEAQSAGEHLSRGAHCNAAALALLSRIYLRQGDTPAALRAAEEASRKQAGEARASDYDALVRLAHAEAVHASGDFGLARELIWRARDSLQRRADRIENPQWRWSFLHGLPDHARTLELARAWSEEKTPP